MPVLGPELDAIVSAHWTRAAAATTLFNGRVFCADTITPALITGHWTEYRRVVALMADPGLLPVLPVRNVAVCGVVCCPDGIAIGRRQHGSIYQPGLWQLPPAGSVDDGAAVPGGADWRRALLTELREELGIPAAAVTAITPLALVQHPTGVLDLGFRIETRLSAADILSRHEVSGDGEYDQLRIIPRSTLLATIEAEGGRVVPASRVFLDHVPP